MYVWAPDTDVKFIQHVCQSNGFDCNEREAIEIWSSYSEFVGVTWAEVPVNPQFVLTQMLTWGTYLKNVKKWQTLTERQFLMRVKGIPRDRWNDINDWEYHLILGPYSAASFAFGLDFPRDYDIMKHLGRMILDFGIDTVDKLIEFREIMLHGYPVPNS